MKTKKTGKLRELQVNAEEVTSKDSSETISRKEIKDSPFNIITVDGESFGVMGDYRLTEKAGTVKEVEKQLKKITWNRIIQVIMLLDEMKNNLKTNKK